PDDLRFALGIIIPELNAAPILKGHKHPRRRRPPSEPVRLHLQLVNDQGVEESDQIGTRRDPATRPDFPERAGTANLVPGLQDQPRLPPPGKVSRKGKSMVPGSHDDHIQTILRDAPCQSWR